MRVGFVLVVAAGLTACHPRVFEEPDTPSPWTIPTLRIALPQPFAAGTDVDLSFSAPSTGLRFVSDNPTVFAIVAQHLTGQGTGVVATGRALANGTTTLHVVDDKLEYANREITVRSVDSIRVFSQAAYRMGTVESDGPLATATALVDGKTAIGVLLLHGDEPVYSQTHLVAVDDLPDLYVAISGAPDSPAETLLLTPVTTGDMTLGIAVGTTVKTSLGLHVVDESAIASVTLAQHADAQHVDRQLVFATPKTATGETILGVYFDWSLNGTPVTSFTGSAIAGDLFAYSSHPNSASTLTATYGAVTASLEVMATSGYVDTSTHLCSAAGTPAESLMMLAVVLGALGISRWRARASARRLS